MRPSVQMCMYMILVLTLFGLLYILFFLIGDSNGVQPIHEAARHGKLECLKFLHRKGSKLDTPDSEGRTPLHKVGSVSHCTYNIVRVFVRHHWWTSYQAKEVLFNVTYILWCALVLQAAQGGALSCVHWLLKSGQNVNTTDSKTIMVDQ